MSKLNQIQAALREIGPARFQQLCDAYLHRRGYERINPIGLVIGADKVAKGTPDTLVALPNGKYLFAEYTTQQEGVCAKFLKDLAKCFDEAKTGVPLEAIEEIILCHTSVLDSTEEHALVVECQKHGCLLNLFGIGPLSHDLYQKFPGLARDFLGVEVDTGQIVAQQEFVTAYNKSAFATPLDTRFLFREDETEQILTALAESDLIIIAGRAGVGKSRLALECCSRFIQTKPKFEVWCVFNRGPDLFEDLRVHFAPSGCYLIFVDDANRVNGFDYVLQHLHTQEEDRKIKIIATVRDYALEKIRKATKLYGNSKEFEIQSLGDDQIKQLISDECGIHNYRYLDRIVDISKGNPRLAIMAGQIAVRENTLNSITDVSALYDEYFSSIKRDIDDLEDRNLLKVAGIIIFFRIIDRSNDATMQAIVNIFNISIDEFWTAAHRLHDLEVLDMYENEVVRVSDQVLATYLFYLTFFKEQVLSFSVLLEHFSPRFRYQFIDILNPLFSAFDSKALIDTIYPQVDRIWKELEQSGDNDNLIGLIDMFWFLKQTDTLLYLHTHITALESQQYTPSESEFKPDANIFSPSILHILSLFRHTELSSLRIAIGLLCDYLTKCPKDLSKVLHLFIEDFGFKHTSYLHQFVVEQTVIGILWEHAQEGHNDLFARVFLNIAELFLHTHFHSHESNKGGVTVYEFDLPPTAEIFTLRQSIWQHVLILFSIPIFRPRILDIVQYYAPLRYQGANNQIVEQDAKEVISFISFELDPKIYAHCVAVQHYLRRIRRHNVVFDEELYTRFRNEAYTISEMLLDNWEDRIDMNWEAYHEAKQKRITEHFASYGLAEYQRFFEQCSQILASVHRDQEEYQFRNGIGQVLITLANSNAELYVEVLKHYLQTGNALDLNQFGLIATLIAICGTEEAYKIVSGSEYRLKKGWLFGFFQCLPVENVNSERVTQLYELYRSAELGELPYSIEYLIQYLHIDTDIIVQVMLIIIEKTDQDHRYGFYLESLFNPQPEMFKQLREISIRHINILKRAYFAAQMTKHHVDYVGGVFNIILDIDQRFAQEYIEWKCSQKEWISSRNDHRYYDFIWKRDDCKEIMGGVLRKAYELEPDCFDLRDYIEVFFAKHEGEGDISEVEDKQNQLLSKMIGDHHNDIGFTKFLFKVIAGFSPDRRRRFITEFLSHNKRFDDFENLRLEAFGHSWSGSAVPMFQKRVDFFESLLPILNTVNLLQHKQRIEQIIQTLREQIEREKKRDFMAD